MRTNVRLMCDVCGLLQVMCIFVHNVCVCGRRDWDTDLENSPSGAAPSQKTANTVPLHNVQFACLDGG